MSYSACLAVFFALASLGVSWRYDRPPLIHGGKLSHKVLQPSHRPVQKKIVVYHNFFRSKVQPPASDMLSMTWDNVAAEAAQHWAGQCQRLTHDNATGRWLDAYGSCGQNIFLSTRTVPWFFAIKTWFLERRHFTYGSDSNVLDNVGHYTQLVWSATHKVGCGFAQCNKYFSYVCNYCPIGNHVSRLQRPYKFGPPCAGCPDDCNPKKLCTNSCESADHWANCGELHSSWPRWLCGTKVRRKHCRATCTCRGKIT